MLLSFFVLYILAINAILVGGLWTDPQFFRGGGLSPEWSIGFGLSSGWDFEKV